MLFFSVLKSVSHVVLRLLAHSVRTATTQSTHWRRNREYAFHARLTAYCVNRTHPRTAQAKYSASDAYRGTRFCRTTTRHVCLAITLIAYFACHKDNYFVSSASKAIVSTTNPWEPSASHALLPTAFYAFRTAKPSLTARPPKSTAVRLVMSVTFRNSRTLKTIHIVYPVQIIASTVKTVHIVITVLMGIICREIIRRSVLPVQYTAGRVIRWEGVCIVLMVIIPKIYSR
jgi:hypothetical protein